MTTKATKLEGFQSSEYRIVILTGPESPWLIERRKDGYESGVNIGTEGFQYYAELKKAWRARKGIFNSLCAEHSFNKPE